MSDPITDTQLAELQRTIRNRGAAGREIHNYIHAALNGDPSARHFCAGVWKARHADKADGQPTDLTHREPSSACGPESSNERA